MEQEKKQPHYFTQPIFRIMVDRFLKDQTELNKEALPWNKVDVGRASIYLAEFEKWIEENYWKHLKDPYAKLKQTDNE